jgi:hypothetical protein
MLWLGSVGFHPFTSQNYFGRNLRPDALRQVEDLPAQLAQNLRRCDQERQREMFKKIENVFCLSVLSFVSLDKVSKMSKVCKVLGMSALRVSSNAFRALSAPTIWRQLPVFHSHRPTQNFSPTAARFFNIFVSPCLLCVLELQQWLALQFLLTFQCA